MTQNWFSSGPWAVLPAVGEKLFTGNPCDNAAGITQTSTAALTPAFLSTEPMHPSIGVLSIRGVILPYSSPWATLLGATCLDQLSEDFCRARDDPDIKAIVLAIDSPGGMITGVHAFSQQVFAARSVKPILALVSGLAASAAYWIAAAASEIRVDPTASLGSIGVIATYQDSSERDKKAGIQTTQIVSSQSPYKRPEMTTDSGRSQCQQQVDALAEVFVSAVATYRSVSPEKVLTDFGQGALVVGEAAVRQGLADQVQTFADLNTPFFNHVTGEHAMSTPTPKTALSTPPPKTALQQFIDSPAYKAHNDEIKAMLAEDDKEIQDLYDQGFAAGKVAERERIQSIEAQALLGHEALLQRLKADGVSTGSDAAVALLAAEKRQREEQGLRCQQDAPAALPPLETTASALPLEAQCAAEWQTSASLQQEFRNVEVYTAYRRAEAQGLIKLSSQEKPRC